MNCSEIPNNSKGKLKMDNKTYNRICSSIDEMSKEELLKLQNESFGNNVVADTSLIEHSERSIVEENYKLKCGIENIKHLITLQEMNLSSDYMVGIYNGLLVAYYSAKNEEVPANKLKTLNRKRNN